MPGKPTFRSEDWILIVIFGIVVLFYLLMAATSKGATAGPPPPPGMALKPVAQSPKAAALAATAGKPMTALAVSQAGMDPISSAMLVQTVPFTNHFTFAWDAQAGNPSYAVFWFPDDVTPRRFIGTTQTTSVNIVATNVPKAFFDVKAIPNAWNGNAAWYP